MIVYEMSFLIMCPPNERTETIMVENCIDNYFMISSNRKWVDYSAFQNFHSIQIQQVPILMVLTFHQTFNIHYRRWSWKFQHDASIQTDFVTLHKFQYHASIQTDFMPLLNFHHDTSFQADFMPLLKFQHHTSFQSDFLPFLNIMKLLEIWKS